MEVDIIMGLELKKSETFGYLAKKRDIEIAKKMYVGGMNKEEIIHYTELTEEEFENKVVKRL